MDYIQFTAGRLLCGRIREFLEDCRFRGMDISWRESSGLLSRNFTIKGSEENLQTIKEALAVWAAANNLNKNNI